MIHFLKRYCFCLVWVSNSGSYAFLYGKKKKSKVKSVFHVMKIMLSLMAYPAFEVIPGPGRGSAGQPVVRLRSFEGAGPVIARELETKKSSSESASGHHTHVTPAGGRAVTFLKTSARSLLLCKITLFFCSSFLFLTSGKLL